MLCDERLEFRVTAAEKMALVRHAETVGCSVSGVLRRAMKIAMDQPDRINADAGAELVVLRRRINVIEQKLAELEPTGQEADRLRADLRQLRLDVQRLLARC